MSLKPQGPVESGETLSLPNRIPNEKDEILVSYQIVSGVSAFRCRLVSTIIMLLYTAGTIIGSPILSMYVNYRKGQEYFGSSNVSVSRSVPCSADNSSSPDDVLRQRVQQETSDFLLHGSFLIYIPALFVNLVYGSYSDYMGRRTLFLVSILGILFEILLWCFIIIFNMNIYWFYLGFAAEGLCGTYASLLVACYSINADVIQPGQKRTVAIAILDGLSSIVNAVFLLAAGSLIKNAGYIWSIFLMIVPLVVAVGLVVCCLPETVPRKRKMVWSPFYHLKTSTSFYLSDGTWRRRLQFLLNILVFFFAMVGSVGRTSLEALYQLDKPFCWDADSIGYFSAVSMSTRSLGAMATILLLTRCMSEELVEIVALLFSAGGFVMEGLAYNGLMLYFVCVLNFPHLAVTAITRSIISRMSPPEKQGAVFTGLAAVEAVCGLSSSIIYNAVYSATLMIFRGTVFLVMAGTCVVALVLIVIFVCITGRETIIHPSYTEHIEKEKPAS